MNNIEFFLNGKLVSVNAPLTKRLLDVLRQDMGMTAVKEGCGEGECGACSVIMDGLLVNSCMIPIGNTVGRRVETLEALRESDQGRCIIEAFADSGAVQCGFCTPGMVMASAALLRENPHPSIAEIKSALSGNLCRCTGYDMIIKGVQLAAERGEGLW
ncbi:MAG: (2Fe-2S)-binding protein [Spirochaetales bacterium]|nr:(2Fe-2S)-binding protein [Spirochaetales bacterium]